jgi:predicted transcriptional regulator
VKSDKDRKILWRNVDPSRKIIYRENMPLSVPFSQLSDPSSLDVINLLLDNEEAVLVTLFRD